jgi:3-hydroxyacyl-CoA dehydrogenase
MGGGIAAHLANLGLDVLLLDLTGELARAGLERATKARPPHFYSPDAAARVRAGALDAHLPQVAEADWVCEAVVEQLDVKKELFASIEPHLRPDAMVSTNTSGLQIGLLAEGRSDSFRRRFVGTHFFNPPRYLKLLELIPTHETAPEEVERMTRFLEDEAGRRVVVAKDTPGFIANRYGMWAMIHTVHVTERLRLTVEQVDAITGPFLGRPRSASFRLNDIVGLDIMAAIAENIHRRCPDDPAREWLRLPPSLATLIERGALGDKAGMGYYRREGKSVFVFDLNTMAYRERLEPEIRSVADHSGKQLGERVRLALEAKDEAGDFLRAHLIPALRYASQIAQEISHGHEDFDRVMRWGFGWELGPFQMIDAIGPAVLDLPDHRFYRDGEVRSFAGDWIPVKSEPQYRALSEYPLLEAREGFNVRDLGDGVTALGLATKMGTLDPALVGRLAGWLSAYDGPLVLAGETRAFSAGFNLKYFLEVAAEGRWDELAAGLEALQGLSLALSASRTVAAVHGVCLGGGFEIAMACPSIIAHPEAQLGLPESRVGLLPAGTGTTRLRLRYQGSAQELAKVALRLTEGAVAPNAAEAKRAGYLRPTDVIAPHPDRLIADAKALALTVQPEPLPDWKQVEGPLGGMIDRALDGARAKGDLTAYDITIGEKIKAIVSRSTSVSEALRRERDEFVELLRKAPTQARIRHMLETGKPLRN